MRRRTCALGVYLQRDTPALAFFLQYGKVKQRRYSARAENRKGYNHTLILPANSNLQELTLGGTPSRVGIGTSRLINANSLAKSDVVLGFRRYNPDQTALHPKFFRISLPNANTFQLEDWYTITRSSVEARGGHTLFRHFKNLPEALQAVYPLFEWDPHKFVQAGTQPANYWLDKSNLLRALDVAEKRLGITQVIL